MSSQADLFNIAASEPEQLPEPEVFQPAQQLRDYQIEAVEAVERELQENRGTLVLCATGLGKTSCAAELIRRSKGRCLFVAHRDELIQQAATRIEQFTGEWPDIEQAQAKADARGGKHVVASVQTLSRKKRLERWDPSEFGLIIVDECHHATAKTYRRIIDYFDGKVVGLTATGDRADRVSLGQVMDSVAYRYEINDAIRDGWLCEIVMKTIRVGSLDFSKLHTVAGDFNQGELEQLMQLEQNLHAVAKPTVECSGDRKTVVFTTSVAHAERLAEIIDRYAGDGSAKVIHGSTPKELRRSILREFDRGDFQYLTNVGVLLEGWDSPGVSCVSMARPTKSRALFAQAIGRGTRGGTLCPVEGKDDGLLVLDFVGNSGKHELVCTADILGGNVSPEELEIAKKLIEKSDKPKSIDEAVEEAKAKIAHDLSEAAKRRRSNIVGEVEYDVKDFNPFTMFRVRRDYLTERHGIAPATEKQMQAITKWMGKHGKHAPANLSKSEASKLLAEFASRREKGLATYGQVKFLATKKLDARGWSFHQASQLITWISSHGWINPPPSVVASITRGREPGEDG
jgi:superfamily II DNA or RNA helicase